ncbi:MAG: ABC transporter substrate-binding protein [Acidimicrobiia bacterium]
METTINAGTSTPRRRWRRVAAALAALALVATAAACGDDDDGADTSSGSGGGSGSGSEDGGSAPSGEPLKIGVLVTTSGPLAALGNDQNTGMKMAAEELNEQGGILGRPIELILKDDAGDPTKAAQGMRELIDREGVELVYGPTLSSSVLAALAVSSPAKVVEMHSGSAEDVSDAAKYPYGFRTAPNTVTQTLTFVELAEEIGAERIGVLAVNQALGTSTVDNLKDALEGTDIELGGVEFFDIGAVDVTTQAQKVKDAGADLLIAAASGVGEYAAIVKARNQLDWDVPVASFATMANPLVTEGAGGASAMEGVYAGQVPLNFTDPLPQANADWLERVRAEVGQDPLTRDISQIAAGYDGLMMLAEAIEDAGEVDTDAIKAYFESNELEGLQGTYTYDEDRHDGLSIESLTFVEAASFSDGTYVKADL